MNRFLEDIAFSDSHTIWAQHSSGTFSQIDLRDCVKPIDAVSRVAVAWEASGSLAFVSDRITSYEIPYDDVYVSRSLVFCTIYLIVSQESFQQITYGQPQNKAEGHRG